jgi:hypothetical protein
LLRCISFIKPGFGTGYGMNLLYVPGWTFLGASYGMGIVQGFYQAELAAPLNPPFTATSISPELANTNFTPIALSWARGARLVHLGGVDRCRAGRIALGQHVRQRRSQS